MTHPKLSPKLLARGLIFAAFFLAVFFLTTTLTWEYEHDTPLLNYAGFLMSRHGQVPYRDFFETSMPGVFAFHFFLVEVFGTGDLQFMLVGNSLLIATAAIGSLVLRPLGVLPAVLFFPVYTAAMLMLGPTLVLQRDWLVVLPLSTALLLTFRSMPANDSARRTLLGALFGMAALIKPQLAACAPVVILADVALVALTKEKRAAVWAATIAAMCLSLLGFIFPIGIALAWLCKLGALDEFWFILTGYLPLHIQQTGDHRFLPESERLAYIARWTLKVGGFGMLLPPVALTMLIQLSRFSKLDYRQRVVVLTLFVLLLIYLLVPAAAGQFWAYHYMPFLFVALLLLCAALAAVEMDAVAWRIKVLAVFLVALSLGIYAQVWGTFSWHNQAKSGAVARMEGAIHRHLPDQGRVQPIDWTAGVLHAMLRTETPIATPFFYDYHFHHHVSTETNRLLRQRFMSALEARPPALIVEAIQRPKVRGRDVDRHFPEFEAFLTQRYELVEETEIFKVFRLSDHTE